MVAYAKAPANRRAGMKMSERDREDIEGWAVIMGVSVFFTIGPGFEWILKDIFFSFLIAGLCFFTAFMHFVCLKRTKVHLFPAITLVIVGILIPIIAIWQGRLFQGRCPF